MCDYLAAKASMDCSPLPLLSAAHEDSCDEDQLGDSAPPMLRTSHTAKTRQVSSDTHGPASAQKKRRVNAPTSPLPAIDAPEEAPPNMQNSAASSCSGTSSSANSFSDSTAANQQTGNAVESKSVFSPPKTPSEERCAPVETHETDEDSENGTEGFHVRNSTPEGHIKSNLESMFTGGKAAINSFFNSSGQSAWSQHSGADGQASSEAGNFGLNSSAFAAVMASMGPLFGSGRSSPHNPVKGGTTSTQLPATPGSNLNPMLAAAAAFASGRFPGHPNYFLGGRMGRMDSNSAFMRAGMKRSDESSIDTGGHSPIPSPMRCDSAEDSNDDNTSLHNSNGQQWTFEEQFKQLYELSDDPKRREFLDDLFTFMQKRGTPVNRIPIMAKQVLDLHALYQLVVSRGGLVEVINKKLWREITKGLNLPSSITSAAFTLRTQYMKYLYPYECEKLRLSSPSELQSAIDGNRREARRASYNFDYPMLLPGGDHLSPTVSHCPVTSPESNTRISSGQSLSSKKPSFDFAGQLPFPTGGSLFSGNGMVPPMQNLFSTPPQQSSDAQTMMNFFNSAAAGQAGNLFGNHNSLNSTPITKSESGMKRLSSSPAGPLSELSIHADEEAKDHSRVSPFELLRKHLPAHNSDQSRDEITQKLLAAAHSVMLNGSAQGMKQQETKELKRPDSAGPKNLDEKRAGSLNVTCPSFRIYTQPGSQMGLPSNSLVMGLEMGGTAYRGVLFAQEPNNSDQTGNKARN
ncbi:AT-rich interactive domain-containing protein 3A [Cichlidogyrus casuarinus]|uniref:AT-rich interactive domain-containing protein 3A n=1 Tax=Cichlidogyrus casuarinus TaxID=1844966 RepID=A0ABD2QMT5_9PLAT